jgi:hypothetical protein
LFASLSAADRGRAESRKSSETLMFVQIGIVCGVIVFLVTICAVFAHQNKMKMKEDQKLEEMYLRNLVTHSEKIIEEELEMDSWEVKNDEEAEEEAEKEDEDENLSWIDELLDVQERLREEECDFDHNSNSQMFSPVSKEHYNNYSRGYSFGSEPVRSQEYNNTVYTEQNNKYNYHFHGYCFGSEPVRFQEYSNTVYNEQNNFNNDNYCYEDDSPEHFFEGSEENNLPVSPASAQNQSTKYYQETEYIPNLPSAAGDCSYPDEKEISLQIVIEKSQEADYYYDISLIDPTSRVKEEN